MTRTRFVTLAGAAIGLMSLCGLAGAQINQVIQVMFDGAPQIQIGDRNGVWALWAGQNFHIRQGDRDRIVIDGNGVTHFQGEVVAPVFHTSSSRTGKTDIRPLGEAEARNALVELQAVSYNQINDPTRRPMLGFIAEDVPALLAAPNRDSLSAMHFTAVAVTVLQAQQREIEQLRSEIAELRQHMRRD